MSSNQSQEVAKEIIVALVQSIQRNNELYEQLIPLIGNLNQAVEINNESSQANTESAQLLADLHVKTEEFLKRLAERAINGEFSSPIFTAIKQVFDELDKIEEEFNSQEDEEIIDAK